MRASVKCFGLFLFSVSLMSARLEAASGEAWVRVQSSGELRWCGDTAGGAPYIFPDEKDPSRIIGFEMDLMQALAERLAVRQRLVLVPWEQLVPALRRGDCDVVVNGLEITPEREAVVRFSRPYFYFAEQITVRAGDAGIRSVDDLRGRRTGTLGASLAESILQRDPAQIPVAYPSAVEAYNDLARGRIDAVFMDDIIAAWYAAPMTALRNLPDTVGEGRYGMAVRTDSPQLLDQLNRTLDRMIQDGTLQGVYERWNLWTPRQQALLRPQTLADETRDAGRDWTRFLPLMLQGAVMTVVISIGSMTLAVIWGFLLCCGVLYGGRAVRGGCHAYIEIVRGTPLLIQLYLLYYGLPNLGIQLNALVAAFLGLGMNYAAYEAEIYRAGLLSIPKGQTDAARSLGLTPAQTLRLILIPQAFRTVLPPSTNDFIALFKDTSLVSIITVTELTRVYSTAATTTYRFLELGLVTAALYFAMSYPLAIWSRRLERTRHAALH